MKCNKNKKKKLFFRGYTLIELLAVIVILAVIALIAVPIALNLVKNAKVNGARASAYGYIDAINYNNEIAKFDSEKFSIISSEDVNDINQVVKLKGKKPTSGTVEYSNDRVTYANICINGYVVEYDHDVAEVLGQCNDESLKMKGFVKLSSSSGNYVYPHSDTFSVIENKSNGVISCSSSDEKIATCSVSDNIITVTPGEKEGQANITVKSEGNNKYADAYAVYLANTDKGLLSHTSSNYNNTYDGNPHGITVTSSNSVIRYGLNPGVYDLDVNPTFTDVGEYTVYYEVTQAGYSPVTGSAKVIITKADGNITLEKSNGSVSYESELEVLVTENKGNGELNAVSTDSTVAQASIENGKLVILGKGLGTTKITIQSAATKNYKSSSTEFTISVVKAKNSLKLSSNVGSYTYPTSGTFEITENLSNGTLSCESLNTEIADCSIRGYTVTVTPGKTKGDTTIIIKSAETSNYEASQVAYVVTTDHVLVSYTANDTLAEYDGRSHEISVTSSNSTIKYGTEEGNYNLNESPKYTDVGEYTVYFKIEQGGYNSVTGSRKVKISKTSGSVTAPTAKTLVYNENEQELINVGSSNTGTVEYKLGASGTYSTNIPKATNPGTYIVYYKVVGDKNHNDVAENSIDVTITSATLNYSANGYSGVYDGNAHSIEVLSSGTIKYGMSSGTYNLTNNPTFTDVGEYTVYYQITKEGYNTVTGNKTVQITKADNVLNISLSNATYTYPTSGTFEITENKSNGELSCITSDPSVATCSISGSTVTVNPGTKADSATITIKSAETKNYNEGQAAHVAITAKGTLTGITASNQTFTYDGQSHGLTVSSAGSTIKYGTSENSVTEESSPTFTDVGIYTVYYEITKAGYNVIKGNKTVTITKADGSVTAPTAISLTYSGSSQNLINAGSSTTGTVQYKLGANGTYSTSIPKATNAGTYTIYYKVVGDSNHKDVDEASFNVTISKTNGSVTAPTTISLTYNGSSQNLINAGSSNTGTVEYKLGASGTYSTSIPKATNPGTYIVYYKVVGDSNHNDVDEASINVTISKKENTLRLSSGSGTFTYPNNGTFTITTNESKGTLSCESADTSVATCSISGNTVTVTPGTKGTNTTITVKSDSTTYYESSQAAFEVITKKGTITGITANAYNGKYDGEAHTVTITCEGSTITYSTSLNGTYSSNKPSFTNVGTYTVYYKIERTGYTTVNSSIDVKIESLTASDIGYSNSSNTTCTDVQCALDDLADKLK